MALWEVTLNGDTTIEYSDGGYSQSPSISGTWVRRHTYNVPYTNVGKGGFIERDGVKFHVPSWTEVHPQTTLDDIVIEKKPFDELFAEPEKWEFKSASSDKLYIVKRNKHGDLSCDCWGYIAHRKCKHIKEVNQIIKTS